MMSTSGPLSAPQVQSQSTATSLASSIRSYRGVAVRVGHRLLPTAIVLIAVMVIRGLRNHTAARMGNEAFASGYSLAAICVLLMLLGIRKRMFTKPIGKLAIWQRTHHYLGLLSIAAYALHAGGITTGWLESTLALFFWAIAISGLVTWYVNRTSPRLLRAAGPQILRHDIPRRCREIREQAYQLALQSAGKSDTAALADHFGASLSSFFSKRRSVFYRLSPTGTQRRKMLAALENLDRYLSEDGKEQRKQMSELLQEKDDMDFQSAIQNRVRLCAAMHTWLLGGFLVLTIVHILIAHRFASSW